MPDSVRPLYESAADMAAEERVAAALEQAWGAPLIRLPRVYQADYAAEQAGRIVAWIEIKSRKSGMNAHPAVILGLNKAIRLMQLSEATLVPALAVFEFTDALCWTRIKSEHLRNVIVSGRRDRNDPQDIEPCIQIAVSELMEIRVAASACSR